MGIGNNIYLINEIFLKLPFIIVIIIFIIFFQNFFIGRYSLASNIRDGQDIFKNVCASCHVRGGLVVTKGSKSLKISDLEQRGIADVDSIRKIANEGIGFMKGYKNKLKGEEDKVLAKWLLQQSKKGWN